MDTSDFIIKLKYGGFIKKIECHEIVVTDDVNDAKHFTMSQILRNPYIKELLKSNKANFYGRKVNL